MPNIKGENSALKLWGGHRDPSGASLHGEEGAKPPPQ